MFVDAFGNLQCETIEDLKANQDAIIEFFQDWEIPSIETIGVQVCDLLYNYIEIFGNDIDVDMIFNIIKLGLESGIDLIDSNINNDLIHLKLNDYINRCYIAMDIVKQQL